MIHTGKTGSIQLILGCMFSGKTSELIRRYDRYRIGNKKCLMIKYRGDTRYDKTHIVTHDNKKINAMVCEMLYEMDDIVSEYDAIFIDEIQFYKDADIFCDKWAFMGKIVVVCGLNGTSNRDPFPIISKLLPLVEDITYLTAICTINGENANYSKRTCSNKEDILIGGIESYCASDRNEFYESPNEYLSYNLNKLHKIYEELNASIIDDNRESINNTLIGLNNIIKKIESNL
jgi:thymidine kinase